MSGRRFTPEEERATAARVRELRERGLPWVRIADLLGIDHSTARCLVDPEYRQMRRRAVNAARRRKQRPGSGPRQFVGGVTPAATKTDAEHLARLIPEDTRSLTGQLLGDPLPGRSALDTERWA